MSMSTVSGGLAARDRYTLTSHCRSDIAPLNFDQLHQRFHTHEIARRTTTAVASAVRHWTVCMSACEPVSTLDQRMAGTTRNEHRLDSMISQESFKSDPMGN